MDKSKIQNKAINKAPKNKSWEHCFKFSTKALLQHYKEKFPDHKVEGNTIYFNKSKDSKLTSK